MAGEWIVRDLGSKNGVRANGARVRSHALNAGDVLRFGDAVAVVVEAAAGTDLSLRWLEPGLFGGHSHAAAFAEAQRVASEPSNITPIGATGTGKDRFARALHLYSGRTGPLVATNCAVYTKSTAAAQLFGYKKGSFTDASEGNLGHVRAADTGTLFLDELPELPLDVQAMLLRAIESGEILPLSDRMFLLGRAGCVTTRCFSALEA